MYDLDWMSVEVERQVLLWMSCGMIVSAPVVFGVLLTMPAPYGRYVGSVSWGWLMDARCAWFLQELPSLAVPCVLWLCHTTTLALPNKLLLGVFVVHYIHRSVVYPALMTAHRSMPCSVFLLATLMTVYNGVMQTSYLLYVAVYPDGWVTSATFLSGMLLCVCGMAVNIHSDHILTSLRRQDAAAAAAAADRVYKIPRGGLFEYVSCANLLGEVVEWSGYAVACWSLPAAAFALMTVCNLAPRAIHHHRWYTEKFEDYPVTRRALIPFVL